MPERASGRGDMAQQYVEDDFDRDTDYIEDRITADGRPAPGSSARAWPVEPGRYRLVAARACPWANRAVIVRRLLGLEDVLSMGVCGPTHDERNWTFDLDPGGRDPVLGIERLQEAFFARDPDYPPRTPRSGSPCRRSSTSPAARSSRTTSPRSPSTCPPNGAPTTAPAPPTCTP